jgi:succinate dehydrogenase flavin-adding protein (antitoxin of CptAB toxin-antitoxin module)
MPPIQKLKKFLDILNDLDDETMSLISKLSETKKKKLYENIQKAKSSEIDIKQFILNICD